MGVMMSDGRLGDLVANETKKRFPANSRLFPLGAPQRYLAPKAN